MIDALRPSRSGGQVRQVLLLIQEEPHDLPALTAILAQRDLVIMAASSLPQAVRMVREHDITLVMLNLVGNDHARNDEACRILHHEHTVHVIPIICIGATARPLTLRNAVTMGSTAGAVEHLAAPVEPALLQKRVAVLLELDLYRRRLQNAQDTLNSSRSYYESIIDAVEEGVIGLSVNGAIQFANPAALDLLGCNAGTILGRRFHLFYPLQGETDAVWQYTPFFHCWLSRSEQTVSDTFFRRAGGTSFAVAFRCAPMPNKDDGVVVAFHDMTVRRQLETRLRQQAMSDPLTGLSNRNALKLALQESARRAHVTSKSVALLSIDLDYFNRVNNTLGHDIGDYLLQSVAHRLQECIGEFDLISRIGGDEFAIVLSDLEKESRGMEVAEAVLAGLRRPFVMRDGLDITVGASIGVATYPAAGNDMEIVMRCAEVALHQAKVEGRNLAIAYTPGMNARAGGRLALEQALRQAVEQRSFALHYQPQIDLASGALVGFEALLRWKHPEIGNITPSKFVPMLEETGLIIPIGQWTFEIACQQRMRWASVLPDDCSISVNLSPRQFTDKRLVSHIQHLLEIHQLPPSWLEIELTESMLMLDTEYTHGVLHALKRLGLRLSIDDFGTGYSSLAYLKFFSLDVLKIDKHFIDHITTSKRDAAIAMSIIQLAHNLGLKVIAEGVELLEQVRMLREMGCDIVQGYYYGKPMASTDVIGFPHQMVPH